MLDRSPKQPTMQTNLGFWTSWGSTNRWMASRKIERHKATKKTPLTSAPRVSARCHCIGKDQCQTGLRAGHPGTLWTTYAICVHLRVCFAISHLDGPETDAKRQDIIELGYGSDGRLKRDHADPTRVIPYERNQRRGQGSGRRNLISKHCQRLGTMAGGVRYGFEADNTHL